MLEALWGCGEDLRIPMFSGQQEAQGSLTFLLFESQYLSPHCDSLQEGLCQEPAKQFVDLFSCVWQPSLQDQLSGRAPCGSNPSPDTQSR